MRSRLVVLSRHTGPTTDDHVSTTELGVDRQDSSERVGKQAWELGEIHEFFRTTTLVLTRTAESNLSYSLSDKTILKPRTRVAVQKTKINSRMSQIMAICTHQIYFRPACSISHFGPPSGVRHFNIRQRGQ